MAFCKAGRSCLSLPGCQDEEGALRALRVCVLPARLLFPFLLLLLQGYFLETNLSLAELVTKSTCGRQDCLRNSCNPAQNATAAPHSKNNMSLSGALPSGALPSAGLWACVTWWQLREPLALGMNRGGTCLCFLCAMETRVCAAKRC